MAMEILRMIESKVRLLMVFASLIVLSFHVLPSLCYTSFVFGDSLVDAGNNHYLLSLSEADSPPYGVDFTPSGGQPTGRFTNGRTISDIIDEALGAKSFPPPYLAPSTKPDTFLRGINYASGASGILDTTGTFFIGRIPLREQVDYFEQSRREMVNMMGENATVKLLKNAMFSLTIGSNDILNYIQPSVPFYSEDTISAAVFQEFMVSNLTIQLKRLQTLGARKFIVVGIGPLGCIPFVRTIKLVPNGECSVKVNELVQSYNKKLKQMLDHLNQDMEPETLFIYANSYEIVMGMRQNYHEYGFENVGDPCCGGKLLPFICFKGPNGNASSLLCDDRSKYVFWDAYHPTEAANRIIARKLLNGDENISYPMNIRDLYNYKSYAEEEEK